jgi:hypothetical protein
MQVTVDKQGLSFIRQILNVYQLEGLAGLYRGIGITALGSMPAGCLYFTSYEMSKSILEKWTFDEDTTAENRKGKIIPAAAAHFTSGLIAEIFSCILWVPIDVIKERMVRG